MAKRLFDSNYFTKMRHRKVSPNGQLIFVHLYLSESVNPAGFYEVDAEQLASDAGLSVKDVCSAMEELETAELIQVDFDQNLVFIKGLTITNGYHVNNHTNARSIANTIRTYQYSPLAREYFNYLSPMAGKYLKNEFERLRDELKWN